MVQGRFFRGYINFQKKKVKSALKPNQKKKVHIRPKTQPKFFEAKLKKNQEFCPEKSTLDHPSYLITIIICYKYLHLTSLKYSRIKNLDILTHSGHIGSKCDFCFKMSILAGKIG